jgi:3-isopropylmalate/(R)-2-methylmalate dehydratase large subunit
MAIEAGARAGIIEADETTMNYVKAAVKLGGEPKAKWAVYKSDADAGYAKVYEWDVPIWNRRSLVHIFPAMSSLSGN